MKYITGLLLFISLGVNAQGNTKAEAIIGVWKGTSTCQIIESACNDETVVYRVSTGPSKNLFVLNMNKVVLNNEEVMGSIMVTYSDASNNFTCKTYDRKKRELLWTFKVEGNELKGTLTVEGGKLYRIINTKKEK